MYSKTKNIFSSSVCTTSMSFKIFLCLIVWKREISLRVEKGTPSESLL